MKIETSQRTRDGVRGVLVTFGRADAAYAVPMWLTLDEAADLAADLIAPDAAKDGRLDSDGE